MSHYHRHAILHPFRDTHRSGSSRAFEALETLYGAIGEHPAVSAVGVDAILSGLSLGIWAVVKGLDGWEVMALRKSGDEDNGSKKEEVEPYAGLLVSKSPLCRSNIDILPRSSPTEAKRRPGRPKKETETLSKTPARKSQKPEADQAYRPTENEELAAMEGDEEVEDEDWEVGALVWGILTLGGLGVGTTGVLGGNVSR